MLGCEVWKAERQRRMVISREGKCRKEGATTTQEQERVSRSLLRVSTNTCRSFFPQLRRRHRNSGRDLRAILAPAISAAHRFHVSLFWSANTTESISSSGHRTRAIAWKYASFTMSIGNTDMQTCAARLRTFETAHQLSKRRASSQASKKKGANTVEWPHARPTPQDVCQALVGTPDIGHVLIVVIAARQCRLLFPPVSRQSRQRSMLPMRR